MTWKKVNQSDAGTASKFGGNDVDKISDAFSGTDVDDIDMNCDFTTRDNKLHYRNPANTFSYNVRTSAIGANRDVTEPLLTSNDTRVYQAHTQTLTNKTIDIRDNPLTLRENTYLIFKDGSTYYARNGNTGALTSNSVFSTLLQNIINTIPTRDDTIFTKIKIGVGNFDVNATITISNKYNLSIEGSGMGLTRIRPTTTLGLNKILVIEGSVSGTGKNLTSNTTNRGITAVMSSGDASTFAVGDTVLLRSNADFATGGSASGHQGEIKQIRSISSGTITFREIIFDTYNTADGANIIKLLPSKYISLADFSIVPGPSYAPASDVDWCKFIFVDRMLLDNVESVDYPGTFRGNLQFNSCTNVRASNLHFEQTLPYNFNYGISFHCACQNCVVTNSTSNGDFRHPFTAAAGEEGTNEEGICRNIRFVNCTATGGSQNAFNTHPEGEGIYFINCGVLGANTGGAFKLRSRFSAIIGCYIQSIEGFSQDQHAIKIADFATDCIISNCHIINCIGDGIRIADGLDGTVVEGCIIRDCSGDGIRIETLGASRNMIRNNVITSNGGDGIDCTDVDESIFMGNRISNNTGFGIKFSAGNCTNNIINSNSFSGNGSGAVSNGGQSGNVETGNRGY